MRTVTGLLMMICMLLTATSGEAGGLTGLGRTTAQPCLAQGSRPFTSPHCRSGQFVDDRAVGPVVAVAAIDEMLKRVADGAQLFHFRVDLPDMLARDGLHVGAGP